MGVLHRIGKATIRVYANDHLPPHFHVTAPDSEALIEIATLEVLRGSLPQGRTGHAILKWAREHRDHIVAEWKRTNNFPA